MHAYMYVTLTSLSDQTRQVWIRTVLKDEVQILLILRRAEQFDDERVVHLK